MALGGNLDAGHLEIEVDWPKDIIPNTGMSILRSAGVPMFFWGAMFLFL
jgi:hypothetical protein